MSTSGATAEQALLRVLDDVANDLSDPTLARQFELEAEMVEDGKHKYWDRVTRARPGTDAAGHFTEREESRTPTAQCLLRLSLNPVRQGLNEFLARSGKGRPHAATKHLKKIEPEAAAFLALKGCLDAFSLNLQQSTLCIRIGRVIEDEVRLGLFAEQSPWLLKAIRERFKSANSIHHRRVLNALAKRYEIDLGEKWPEVEALHVGAALVTLVIERTGLFEVVQDQISGKEKRTTIQPTAQTLEWVRQRDASAQFLFPTYMPTVVAPRPWTTPTNGGYHFGLARRLKLVKNRNRGYQAELRNWDMPAVYESVNALQATPWSVNRRILGYMAEAAHGGSSIGGLPETRIEAVPPAPADIPTDKEARTEAQQDRLRAWKTVARQTHELNLERRQKGLVLARTVAIAQRYVDEPAFYFPYTLDFRGRAYPVASFLQPQGCDYQKALLQFSAGKPLGEMGAAWLAVHGANLMAEDPDSGQKLDKAPLQERIDWVVASEAKIAAVAANPWASDWWTHADSPWMFLAFCFEWAGYMAEGDAFVSYLPIALDGSCNGLQHFSAMLRDEVGGSAVNLIPHERPADIYMEVCKATLEHLATDALGDDDNAVLARQWIASGMVDRGLCKRPVMTMPYGSKQFGIRDQLGGELRKRGFLFTDPETGEEQDAWKHCGYLSAVIWRALGAVVVKAREAMDWLQSCARLASTENLPINWTTPDGFWVQQDYRETFEKKVKTQVAGQLLWPRLQEDTETRSKHRQQNGVAPNFVHSMDGAAMRLCILDALEAGISNFAMIHDSYATHAADTHEFAGCIRAAFIAMYENMDVLASFRENVATQLSDPTQLPAPPLPGSLDLSLVARSDFFFA